MCLPSENKVDYYYYYYYDRGEYDALGEEISNFDWQSLKHQDIDIYTKKKRNRFYCQHLEEAYSKENCIDKKVRSSMAKQ